MPPLHTAAPLFVSTRGSLSVFVPLVLIVSVAVGATVVTPAPCIVPAVQFSALVTNTAPLPSSTPAEKFSTGVVTPSTPLKFAVPPESAIEPGFINVLGVNVTDPELTVSAPLAL